MVGQTPYLCRSNVPLVLYHAYVPFRARARSSYTHSSYDLWTAIQVSGVDIGVIGACANLSQCNINGLLGQDLDLLFTSRTSPPTCSTLRGSKSNCFQAHYLLVVRVVGLRLVAAEIILHALWPGSASRVFCDRILHTDITELISQISRGCIPLPKAFREKRSPYTRHRDMLKYRMISLITFELNDPPT